VAGTVLRAALVASVLRGALPPVDLRAVCLVRAMVKDVMIELLVLGEVYSGNVCCVVYLNSSIGRCSECFFFIISHCDTNLALPEFILKQILRSKKTSVVCGK